MKPGPLVPPLRTLGRTAAQLTPLKRVVAGVSEASANKETWSNVRESSTWSAWFETAFKKNGPDAGTFSGAPNPSLSREIHSKIRVCAV